MLQPQIIYQDNNLLVLNKPIGLTVNRSETTREQETLQDWIDTKFKDQSANIKTEENKDFIDRSGIVHRLDKDTSGVILVAKDPRTFVYLQAQFKERKVDKTYMAFVWGKLTGKGIINAPITRNPYNRSRFGVFVGGKESTTEYESIKTININKNDLTLVKVTPQTGRTHQIRVHLSYIHHPVVGDPLYSGRKLFRLGQKMFNRLMLHSNKIGIIYPEGGGMLYFEAPIPKEFNIV